MLSFRRLSIGLLALGLLAGVAMSPLVRGADAPGDAPPPPPPQGNGQGGPGGGGPGGPGGGPGRGGFHLIPRFAEEKLSLTDDQKKQIADLESDTKAKLGKILSAEQMKTLEEARPPRPGGQGGQGGGGQGGGRPGGQGGPGGGPPGGDQGSGSQPNRPQRPSN